LDPRLDHVERVTCEPVRHAADGAAAEESPDGDGVGSEVFGKVTLGELVAGVEARVRRDLADDGDLAWRRRQRGESSSRQSQRRDGGYGQSGSRGW
jgi:hypothetical protein